jgi:hypothetical protein
MTLMEDKYRAELTDMVKGRHYVIQYSAESGGHVVTEYDAAKMPPRIRQGIPVPE